MRVLPLPVSDDPRRGGHTSSEMESPNMSSSPSHHFVGKSCQLPICASLPRSLTPCWSPLAERAVQGSSTWRQAPLAVHDAIGRTVQPERDMGVNSALGALSAPSVLGLAGGSAGVRNHKTGLCEACLQAFLHGCVVGRNTNEALAGGGPLFQSKVGQSCQELRLEAFRV